MIDKDRNIDNLFRKAWNDQESHSPLESDWKLALDLIQKEKAAKRGVLKDRVKTLATLLGVLFLGTAAWFWWSNEENNSGGGKVALGSSSGNAETPDTKSVSLLTAEDAGKVSKSQMRMESGFANKNNEIISNKDKVDKAHVELALVELIGEDKSVSSKEVEVETKLDDLAVTNERDEQIVLVDEISMEALVANVDDEPLMALKLKSFEPLKLSQSNLLGMTQLDVMKQQLPIAIRLNVGTRTGADEVSNSATRANFSEQQIGVTVEGLLWKSLGIEVGIGFSNHEFSETTTYTDVQDNSFWDTQTTIETVTNRVWWLGDWYYYPDTYDTVATETFVSQTDSVNIKQITQIRYSTFEVPVLLTYNFPINRWNVQMAAGGAFGYVDTQNNELKKLADKVTMSVLFRSEIAYGLNHNWWINVQPNMRYKLKNNANSIHSDNKMFWGVSYGIAYKF